MRHIGFISTRLDGTDGVSLEAAKWARVIEELGCRCYYLAAELEAPADRSLRVAEAHFKHPEIAQITAAIFQTRRRSRETTDAIYRMKEILKAHIYAFIDHFSLDALIAENALTIPLNLPLGMALTEIISETGIPTIAHHHDFFWERQHFLSNAVWEFLNMAFPPHLPSIHHVVINSSAANQLSLRTGISATLIPNVMDFEHPPPPPDAYAADIRAALRIGPDDRLILQPTRVIQRKGIEHAIELVSRLNMDAKLVISHSSGDEGYDYEQRVRDYSRILGVDTRFVSEIIDDTRGRTGSGAKKYTLFDVYPSADLVTYPSTYEGFGNAFLEAVYFRRPIVVNRYSIYRIDIEPKGFQAVVLDGYVTPEAVAHTKALLKHPEQAREMVEHNYALAVEHYSYAVLERKLRNLICDCVGPLDSPQPKSEGET